jgi:hypothetical protein
MQAEFETFLVFPVTEVTPLTRLSSQGGLLSVFSQSLMQGQAEQGE